MSSAGVGDRILGKDDDNALHTLNPANERRATRCSIHGHEPSPGSKLADMWLHTRATVGLLELPGRTDHFHNSLLCLPVLACAMAIISVMHHHQHTALHTQRPDRWPHAPL